MVIGCALLSACPSAHDYCRECLQEDLEIQSQRPLVDVLQIHGNPSVEADVASPAYLPQAGKARRHAEAPHQPGLRESAYVPDRERARPHQRHLTDQYVPELR